MHTKEMCPCGGALANCNCTCARRQVADTQKSNGIRGKQKMHGEKL